MSDRTKVVIRHLPPTITQDSLLPLIDSSFAGRYNWFSFHPPKITSHNHTSRAYIDFNTPDDVIDFAHFFNGHVFLNQKGTHFKVTVEYAPSQRVPNHSSSKKTEDARDGTIFKDPDYLQFLQQIAKPVENLPSAEIQLDKREALRKDIPIVTPLMDFVRHKRATKNGPRQQQHRSLSNGKVTRRTVVTTSNGSSTSAPSRRGYTKNRVSTTMYVARDPGKSSTVKDKSTYILVPRQGDQNPSNKSSNTASSDGNQTFDENGIAGSNDSGKKKLLLLKGNERETITVSDADSMSQNHTSSTKTILSSTALKQNQRHEGSGRIIKSILTNKDFRQSQCSRAHSERQIQTSNLEREKQSTRPVHVQLILKGTDGAPENRITVHGLHVSSERQERRFRHKDRPDRGVWTSRSNGGGESLSSSASSQVDPLEGGHTELKHDTPSARSGEVKSLGSFRASHSSENGFSKHFGRRGPIYGVKDVDGYSMSSEGKHPRKSSTSAYGSNEKQVWVQKASSGT